MQLNVKDTYGNPDEFTPELKKFVEAALPGIFLPLIDEYNITLEVPLWVTVRQSGLPKYPNHNNVNIQVLN